MAKRKHPDRPKKPTHRKDVGNPKPSHRPSRPERPPAGPARAVLPQREKTAPGGTAWLYGTHAVLAALGNPQRRCLRLLVTPNTAESLGLRLKRSIPGGLQAETVDRTEIEHALAPGAVHQGIALLTYPLADEDLGLIQARLGEAKAGIVVVLDQATDPQNVGAVLRSAAAFGALGVVVPDRHAPEAGAVMAKAASGAMETVPLIRVTNLARALEDLKKMGFWCVGLDGSAAETLAEADLSGLIALVVGAEGTGLRRLSRETCDRLVRIPISGAMESLNLSNACAVALYELARPRG